MTRIASVSVFVLGLVLYSFTVWAEQSSVEIGKKLFNDPALGSSKNATSCGTCHSQGEGMENAAANPQLSSMINRCIQGPLKSEKLSEDSMSMESLKLYINSLAK